MINRESDEDLIRRLMVCQGRYDWDEISRLLADDAVFEMPFIGEKIIGKELIVERWRPALERMEGIYFFDLAFSAMAELFHVREGRIAYFAEYFDSLRLAVAQQRVRPIEEVPKVE